MPNITLSDGTIVQMPDDLSPGEELSLLKRADPDAFPNEGGAGLAGAMASQAVQEVVKLPGQIAALPGHLLGLVPGINPETDILAKGLIGTGQVFDDLAKTIAPVSPEYADRLPVQIAGGLGQMAVQMGLAASTGGTSLLTQGAIAGGTGVAMGVDEAYKDALQHAATPEQQRSAIGVGALSGLTEMVPVMHALGRFGGAIKSRFISSLVKGGIGAAEEAAQEAVQQGMLNIGAADIAGYDPDRSILEGLKQSAEVGGAVGFIANALITALTGKRIKGPSPTISSDRADPEVTTPDDKSTTVDPTEEILNPNDLGGELIEDIDETPPDEFVGPIQPDWADPTGPGWDEARAAAADEVGGGPILMPTEADIVEAPLPVEKAPPVEDIVPAGTNTETILPKVMRNEVGATLEETLSLQLKASVDEPGMAYNAMEIVRARADSADESVDQYIFRRGLSVNTLAYDQKRGVILTEQSGEVPVSINNLEGLTAGRDITFPGGTIRKGTKINKATISKINKILETNDMDLSNLRIVRELSVDGVGTGTVYVIAPSIISEGAHGVSARRQFIGVPESLFNTISIFNNQKPTTIIHELGHVFSFDLYGEDLAVANGYLGYDRKASPSQWEQGNEKTGHEKFVRSFEKYLYTGKTPKGQGGLKAVFERLKEVFRRTYSILKGSPIDYELTPEITDLFDRILSPSGMPTELLSHEMTYSAWKQTLGDNIAAAYGVREASYAIRKAGPAGKVLQRVKQSVFYTTPNETQQRLSVIGQIPDFLTQEMAPSELLDRFIMLMATKANEAFHSRQSVDEYIQVAEERLRPEARGSKVSSDRVESLLVYLNEQKRYLGMEGTSSTALKQSLIDLQQSEIDKGNLEPLLINRHTGVVFKVARSNKYGYVLTDLGGGFAVRLAKGREQTDYFPLELVSGKGSFTMTREEFLLQKHSEMVVDAIDRGLKVPSWVIAPHVASDAYFQQVYDFALKQEETKTQTLQQRGIVEEWKNEVENPDTPAIQPISQVNQETIENQRHPKGLGKRIKIMAGMVDQSYYYLERLMNTLEKRGRVKFVDVIAKADLQRLTNQRGDVGNATVAEYMASIHHELDEIKYLLENKKIDVKDNDQVALSYDRISTIYRNIEEWHTRFEEAGHGDMLDPGATESTTEKIWDWFERNVPFIPESSGSSQVAMAIRKGTMTMHWLSRRFPLLLPLYRLGSTVRFTRKTLITNSILNGSADTEVVEYQDSDGNIRRKEIRRPGLRSLINTPLRGGSYVALQHILLTGDAIQKSFTEEQLRDMLDKSTGVKTSKGVVTLTQTEKDSVVNSYLEVQGTLEWMYFKLYQVLERQFGSIRTQKVMKGLYPKGHIEGYFPHIRSGKYGVAVKNAEGETTYYGMYDRAVDQKKALARLRGKNPGMSVVAVDPNDRISYQYGGGVDVITAIKDVISKADIQGIAGDQETATAIEAALDEATAAIIKSHGMFSMFGKRSDVPGFDERIIHVMARRVDDFGSAIAKVEFAKNGTEELAKLRGTPSIYNYAQDWFGAMLQSGDQSDAMVGKIRQMIFLKYLGFNVKTALVVFADKITNAPSRLGLYTKGAEVKLIKSMAETTKFMRWFGEVNKLMNSEGILREAAVKRVPLPASFDMETANALLWSIDSGSTTAKFIPELMSKEETSWEVGADDRTTTYGKYMDMASVGMDKVFDAASYMLVKVETFNRLSTFHAAYKVFRNEKRYKFDRAIQNSEDVVNDAHFLYGKANIPLLFNKKGLGKWLRTFYTFRSFEHNYVQMLGDLMIGRGAEGKKQAAKSLFYLAALGGVPALPFFMALAKLLGVVTGDDPEQEVLATLNKIDAPEFTGELFSDGLPGLLGTSFRGSLQVGAYDNWEELIAGVAGSTASDILGASKAVVNGDWDTFARKALPTVAGSVYKAVRGRDHGVLSSYGTPLREGLIGKKIKYTDAEFIQKLLSFNPTREARAYRLKKSLTVEDQYWTTRRQAVYAKFTKAIRTNSKAGLVAASADITSYEQDRISRGALDIPRISRESLRNSLAESGLRRREILQVLRKTGQLRGR